MKHWLFLHNNLIGMGCLEVHQQKIFFLHTYFNTKYNKSLMWILTFFTQ